MKGANADPDVNTIRTPRKRSIIIIGNSQNFFLVFKKAHSSMTNSLIVIILKCII